ncbi:hypothetical protein PVAG01_07581 [Phlyctema vagabunda]|uniref:SigF-like NTF2-like domain-containing protein n=1 Tax=Phlyctema vagabunda TaxID=108571 RepID=A0ABR4PCU4_9HELO
MDHPTKQIPQIIQTLTMGSPQEQKSTLEAYFLPNASFTHPLCRVPSFADYTIQLPLAKNKTVTLNSRWAILQIYTWYRILSPKIHLTVNSRDFDQKSSTLFVSITQLFSLFFVPWSSPLDLTTKLHLVQSENDGKYYIKHQEDLYQSGELLKIFIPHQLSDWLVWTFQLVATFWCIVGAFTLAPVTWARQNNTRLVNGKNGL